MAHTATLLRNGKVFVVGGYFSYAQFSMTILDTCEVYDPASNAWTSVASMPRPAMYHSAVLLESGNVLVCGGMPAKGTDPVTACAIYNPSADSWSAAASMTVGRNNFAMVRLSSGRVLAAGGANSLVRPEETAAAEIYDPETDKWTPIESLSSSRSEIEAVLLPSGRVFVTSGINFSLDAGNRPDVLDPSTGSWHSVGTAENVGSAAAVMLEDGRVLVAAGYSPEGIPSDRAFTINPQTSNRIDTTMATAREHPAAVLLASGRVLVAGGNKIEVFDPSSNSWLDGGTLPGPRYFPTATRLANGNILVVGGDNTADIFR